MFAGKAMVRALYAGMLRNKKLVRVAEADCAAEMRAVFGKGHAAALSLYDSPPRTIQFPKAHGGQV